jgi:hypothetical protein
MREESVAAMAEPTTCGKEIDELIIEGNLERALAVWDRIRPTITGRRNLQIRRSQVGERIDFRLQRSDPSIERDADEVRQTLRQFLSLAK